MRAVLTVCAAVLMVFGASDAQANIYKYRAEDGSVLVTTQKRSDLKLIEVLDDGGGGGARKASTGGGGGRHAKSIEKAKALRRASAARAKPREVDETSPRESRYDAIIDEAARTYKLPASFIKGVIRVESNFTPDVVSHTGAMGLMQLMPATAKYLGVEDPFDPRQNIFGGAKLLRMLTNKYNGDINLLLSAYNAGEGAVARYDGIPYSQTREYVRKVYHYYKLYQRQEQTQKANAGSTP